MLGDLVSIIGGMILLILGWVHLRISAMGKRIDDLDERKLDSDDFIEVKSDIKEIIKLITTLQVEQALWRGRAEGIEQNKLDRS